MKQKSSETHERNPFDQNERLRMCERRVRESLELEAEISQSTNP